MELERHLLLEETLIAQIVKNLDHQAAIRGARKHEEIGVDESGKVDLNIEIEIDLNAKTMIFNFASPFSYNIEYRFASLEADMVVELLRRFEVVFIMDINGMASQLLTKGRVEKSIIYSSERGYRRRLTRVAILR